MSRTIGEQAKTGFRLAGGIILFCASLQLELRLEELDERAPRLAEPSALGPNESS